MRIDRAFQTGTNVSLALAVVLSSQLLLGDTFAQTNLVSDVPGMAATTDPNLKNPWGVSFALPSILPPNGSPFWVSNQASGTSTLYDGAGVAQKLIVTIPAGTPPVTGPTGQVFSGGSGFALPSGGPAFFIFDTLNGTIDSWGGGATAVQTASTPGAIYTGLALASSGGSNYLYAADSTGSIRVFDSSYKPVTLAGNFTDPKAIAGYVPFNIQLIGSSLYVTYAQLTSFGTAVPGSNGYVDAFNTDGTFGKRVATGGALFAPWGLTMAPTSGFGSFSGDLLVGNFGNGEILAYNSAGALAGTLNDWTGKPIVNDFLWSLNFDPGGPGVTNPDALYFTAGINNQKDGLFGTIDLTPEPGTVLLVLFGFAALLLFRRHSKI
ncbi:MAG: TIGR03118 family protein [Acidobacteriaceae bacterium]|nr:TIGR03118 family protein [Acidobacteriaceae bacterium]